MKHLARFTDPIRAEFSNDGKSLTLLQGFYYYRKGAQESRQESRIEVPAGFKSDGFSNFGLHFIVKRYGRGLKCAILHDYLCEQAHAGVLCWNGNNAFSNANWNIGSRLFSLEI